MKTQTFVQMCLILALASACQSKKTTLNRDIPQNPEEIAAAKATAAKTEAAKKSENSRKISKLGLLHEFREGSMSGSVVPVYGADKAAAPLAYRATLMLKASADEEAKLFSILIDPSADPLLFQQIDGIFLQTIQVEAKDVGDHKEWSTISLVSSEGQKDFKGALVRGDKTDDIVSDILFRLQNSLPKYLKAEVEIKGTGASKFSIGLPTEHYEECSYLIDLSSYDGKDSNALYCVKQQDDSKNLAPAAAISDLLAGKIELKDGEESDGLSSTELKLVPAKGDALVVKNPGKANTQADQALNALVRYLASRQEKNTSDMKFGSGGSDLSELTEDDTPPTNDEKSTDSDKKDEKKEADKKDTDKKASESEQDNIAARKKEADVRATKTSCHELKLAGTWNSKLVGSYGEVDVTSVLTLESDAKGVQKLKSADRVDVKGLGVYNLTSKWSYDSESCIVKQVTAAKADQKLPERTDYFLVVYAGGYDKQILKLSPCSDASCDDAILKPTYTQQKMMTRIQ